jgi:hypothetical protein
VSLDALGHVLEVLLSQRLESGAQRSANRQAERLRRHHGAWRRDRLQASGDVHAVTVDRPVRLFHHVAQVQTDPEPEPPIGARLLGLLVQVGLDGERRGRRTHRGAENREDRVSRRVDDPPSVHGGAMSKHVARRIEGLDRRLVVPRHQPRIVHRVGGEYRHQPGKELDRLHDLF